MSNLYEKRNYVFATLVETSKKFKEENKIIKKPLLNYITSTFPLPQLLAEHGQQIEVLFT